MTDQFIIREAAVEDAAELLAFLNKVGAETDNLTFGAEGLPFTEEQERSFIRSMHESDNSVMLLALEGSRIVGNAGLSGMSRRMAHRANLAISVDKEHWGKGVGSALLEALIRYASEHGIEIIDLEVRCDNARAIRLYEKFGFRRIGTYPGFFRMEPCKGSEEREYVDFDIMYLDLRQTCNQPQIFCTAGGYMMRPMRETDRMAVLDMMRIFYASDATFTCGSDEIFSADVTACISDSPYIDGFVFVNEDGIPAGYAMIAHSFNTENGKLSIRVEDLYLCEQARGHGLASFFFDFITSKYPGRVLTLETEPENIHAREIYKRRGFEDLPYTEMIMK